MQEKVGKIIDNQEVRELLSCLGEDADLHLVGGAVRDALAGLVIKDLDFATLLTPDQMIKKFEHFGMRFVETGIRRGTLTAVINGQSFEVTTFRNPENETQFTQSILDDLPARDFTINAIAFSLNTEQIVDPFGGVRDLEQGIVRCVRAPATRFTEDPHRILRMVRFGPAAGRTVDPHTLKAGLELKHALNTVSMERISDEFIKILCAERAAEAFRFMERTELLDLILPELRETVGFEQNKYHVFDVFNHILDVLDSVPKDKDLRLAALFHDIGKPRSMKITEKGRQFIGHENVSAEMAEQIMTRLKRPNTEKKKVVTLVKHHMRHINVGPKSVRKTMFVLGDLFEDWLILKKADLFAKRASTLTWDIDKEWNDFLASVEKEKNREEKHPNANLAISGKDLLELGFEQGPEIGKVLSRLQELVLEEPDTNTRDILLKCAKAYRRTVL